MKIGVIVDSSCGLSKDEVEKKGWLFLPLIANINGEDFKDGITLKSEEYFKKMKIEDEVRTSATPPGEIMKVFEKASEQYDKVIVYGLSSELSSQTQNLMTMAKEYENIKVINSKGVGQAIIGDIEEGLKEEGFEAIFQKIQSVSNKMYALFLPKSLKWLVKGGRVSSGVAKMANLMKIVPIISLENGKLEKYGKGRSFSKTAIKCAKTIKDEFPNREYLIYRGAKYEGEDGILNEVQDILGEVKIVDLPPVIGNHTGPELFSIIVRG